MADMRPATRPAPPLLLDQNGSRYPSASELYGWLVTSLHAPAAAGSAAACALAATKASALTDWAGAVRTAAYCEERSISSLVSPSCSVSALGCLVRPGGPPGSGTPLAELVTASRTAITVPNMTVERLRCRVAPMHPPGHRNGPLPPGRPPFPGPASKSPEDRLYSRLAR